MVSCGLRVDGPSRTRAAALGRTHQASARKALPDRTGDYTWRLPDLRRSRTQRPHSKNGAPSAVTQVSENASHAAIRGAARSPRRGSAPRATTTNVRLRAGG